MAMFDISDVLSLLDIFTWRIFISTVIGVGAGAAVFYMSGETPASTAIAVGLGLVGLLAGLLWEFGRESGKRRKRYR
jgi:hypothetical protein